MEAQQNFLKELMRQKLNIQYLPKLNGIINSVFENVETNFTLNEIIKMTGYVSKFKIENLNFISMPGDTYNASPWYFLCNVASVRQITAESFKCDESFVNTDSKAKAAYKNDKTYTVPKATSQEKTTTSDSSTKNSNTQQKNPSNSETSIKGSDQDP